MGGIISGALPGSMGATALQYNPYPESVSYNDGEAMHYYNRDPQTGVMSEIQKVMNRPSPQQQVEDDYRNRALALQNNHFYAELDEQRRRDDTPAELARQGREYEREGWDKEYGLQERKFQTDEDFRRWQMKMQEDAARSGTDFSDRDKAMLEQLNKEYDRVAGDITSLQERRDNTADQTTKSQLNEGIQGLEAKKQQIQEAIYGVLAPRISRQTTQATQQGSADNVFVPTEQDAQTPVWASMVKGEKGDGYGAGGKGFHSGVDIKAVKGSEIRVPKDLGVDTFTVKKVFTSDPVNGGGYGNHVELEGEVNGHKVGVTVAHMQNGSIPLKAGQKISAGELIGRVGNTGRTGNSKRGIGKWFEGKDWGYHMHLTISVGGHRINPENYYKEIAPKNSARQPSQGGMAHGQAAQVQPQTDNSPVMWRHPSGRVMTEKQYKEVAQRILDGDINGVKTLGTYDKMLESRGYTRAQGSSGANQTLASVMSNDGLDWRPSYQKVNMSPALTSLSALNIPSERSGNSPVPESVEIANHATNADVQTGVDKLNEDETAEIRPQEYYYRNGIYPAGLLG